MMSCCGQREKLGEVKVREEQKWDYIVSHVHYLVWFSLISSFAEPVRFQIDNVSHASFLWHSLHFRIHLNCRLWSGYLHSSKFTLLRPLVRSGRAGNTFLHLQMDICWMHLTIVGIAGLSMGTSRAGDTEWCDRHELPGSSCSGDTERAHRI